MDGQSSNPGITIDIHRIVEMIPHRYPFLMVDRLIDVIPGESATGVKNVTANEPFFQGHFPGRPVMPGVLIIEALAQASGLLSLKSRAEPPGANVVFFFAGIDDARFKRPVVPGDTLTLESELLVEKRGLVKYAVRASVGEQLACEAQLLCTMKTMAL